MQMPYMCVSVRFSIGEYMADSHQNAYPNLMQSLNYAQWFWKFTFLDIYKYINIKNW